MADSVKTQMNKAQKKSDKLQVAKKRVLIVDDHPPMRQGLAQLINEETDLVTCGEAGDAQKALEAVENLKPDVAVVDLTLKDSSGLELVKDLKARCPKLPVLVLSMHNESLYAERALRAGAKGYIMKEETTGKIIDALHEILAGEVYLSELMSKKMLKKLSGVPKQKVSSMESLSDRELEVFQLIGQGYPTREIAKKLHRSVKTIESYREHIKVKLNLENASELVQAAVKWVQSEKLSS